MKKEWIAPQVEELSVRNTANGQRPSDDFDSTWVQIGDKWYRPGNGGVSL